MADMTRFTIYVSEAELQRLSAEAERQGASVNFIIRSIIRTWMSTQISQLSHVTTMEVGK